MKDFMTLKEVEDMGTKTLSHLEMIEENLALFQQELRETEKEDARFQKSIAILFPLLVVLSCVFISGCRSHVQWVNRGYAESASGGPLKGVVAYAARRPTERNQALLEAQDFCAPNTAHVVSEDRNMEYVEGRQMNVIGPAPAVLAGAVLSRRGGQRLSPLVYVSFNCVSKGI